MIPPIETLLLWGKPREVATKRGVRLLHKSKPDAQFWNLWARYRPEMEAANISLGKDFKNPKLWEVCWWKPLDEVESAKREANAQLSRAATCDFMPPAPPGLEYFPFQRAGIAFAMANPGTYIADDMGLGKTIQALGLINSVPEIKRVLIVTKATLKVNWQREADKWLIRPFKVEIAEGQYWPRKADVVIINYDILTKHHNALRERPWDLVILDESANIKTRGRKRTIAVIGHVPTKKAQEEGEVIIPPIPGVRRLALSGTPIENRTEEIWTTLNYLDPERWGSFWSFARKYCDAHSNGWGMDTSGARDLDKLQTVLRSTIMIRRLKKDVLKELPPKTRMVIEMDTAGLEHIVKKDAQTYAKYEEDLATTQARIELAKADDNEERYRAKIRALKEAKFLFIDLGEITQIRHDTAVAKVPRMIEMLREELDECKKVLFFAHHHDVLYPMQAAFPGSVIITGQTDPALRQGICDVFQTNPKCRVFFGSTRACGEGLNLTAADLVVFGEEDWAPGKVNQAEDRAHRIGQKDNVFVKHYILPGTMDSKMIKTTLRKQELIDKALNDDHGVDGEITLAPHRPFGKRSEFLDEGLQMLNGEVAAVHAGLRQLSMVCDGAHQQDGQGFNKVDSQIGKILAAQSHLSHGQAALGRKLCVKYGRQLGEAALLSMGWQPKKEEEEDDVPM